MVGVQSLMGKVCGNSAAGHAALRLVSWFADLGEVKVDDGAKRDGQSGPEAMEAEIGFWSGRRNLAIGGCHSGNPILLNTQAMIKRGIESHSKCLWRRGHLIMVPAISQVERLPYPGCFSQPESGLEKPYMSA